MTRPLPLRLGFLLAVSLATRAVALESAALVASQAAELVERLDADTAADRAAAEDALVALAGANPTTAQTLLDTLPEASDRMPPSVRSGLGRVRRRVELALAESATKPATVTIDAQEQPLAEVLRAIGAQTGNLLRDNRDAFGEAGDASAKVTFAAKDEAFWPAVDRLLDAAGLTTYSYGGAAELGLVAKPQGGRPRVGAAAYAGPFRVEPLRVVATRGLRSASEQSLDVDLEIAWEPRLRPIALSQPLADLRVVSDTGKPLAPLRPEQSLDAEVAPGAQGVELRVALALPDRATRSIATLGGRLRALVGGRAATFRFKNPAAGAAADRQGDATVTVERFFKNGAVWELRMRLRIENARDALASHRGWVFQNPSYLETADGRRMDHAGFETTLQNDSEVGLAYLFDLSDEAAEGKKFDPAGLTWVYETAASVVELPVEWELKGIDLP